MPLTDGPKRGGFMLGQELCMMQLPFKNIVIDTKSVYVVEQRSNDSTGHKSRKSNGRILTSTFNCACTNITGCCQFFS